MREEDLLSLSDEDLKNLLNSSRTDGLGDHEKLCQWAYITARNYYLSKAANEENSLAYEDAEELASSFYLEFERALPRIHDPARYTRFVLKQNLGRFLKKQRARRKREIVIQGDHIPGMPEEESPWEEWDDEQFEQYKAVLKAVDRADATTQRIIAFRLEAPPVQFNIIAESLQMSEASVRMRMTRFYSLVRKLYGYKK